MKRLALAILLLCFASAASAEVKLILFPRCEGTGGSLPVSCVAWADGDEEEAAKVSSVRIEEKYYKDGFIDRSELAAVLKKAGFSQIAIVGSSIRITKPDKAKIDLEELAEQSVKRGDAVKVMVKGKGISVETHGTVSADALPGDEVQVELAHKKSIKGTLCSEHVVEVRL